MVRLQLLTSLIKFGLILTVFIAAGLFALIKINATYSFPGIPTCQNCTYGECIKKDTGYICGGSNDRTDVEWALNCSTTPIYTNLTGGTCPVGQTCNQYLSKGACTNNRCILVNNIPPPVTPPPTIYTCGERRSPPNQCTVDYSVSPARYVGCPAGNWCKQYTSAPGAVPDTECRVLCGAGYTYAPGSFCQCVLIANEPIGWFDAVDNNACSIRGWSGDMGNPLATNTVQYQIYKTGTTPGALSSTVTAGNTSSAAVCMALYGNDANYTDFCNQCNTNPSLAQCKHAYNINISGTPATDGQQYTVNVYGNNIPGTSGTAQVLLGGSPKTLSCNKAPACSSVSASTATPVLGTSVTFTANVSDATGIVNSVTFYRTSNSATCAGRTVIPGAIKINDNTWRVTLDTTGLAIGTSYQIYAVVNDNGQPQMSCSGNNTCTAGTVACASCNTSITIQTNNQAPTCSGIATTNATPVQGTSVTFTATVADTTGLVNNVTFYRTTNAATCAGRTAIPGAVKVNNTTWRVTLDTTGLIVGTTYQIYAVVNDDGTPTLSCSGNNTCTAGTTACASCISSITILVNNQAPTCSALSVSTANPVQGTSVTFTANVADTPGIVNSVAFYRMTNNATCAGRTVIPNPVKVNNTTWRVTLDTSGLAVGTPYFIHAVVNDDGTPSLSCSGNTSCSVANTLCAACQTQIIVYPQCNDALTLTPTTECNNITFEVGNTPAGYVATGLTVPPASAVNCSLSNPNPVKYTCDLLTPDEFEVEHTYNKCVGIYCSSCAQRFDTTGSYISLACNEADDIDLMTNPTYFYYGDSAELIAYAAINEVTDPQFRIDPTSISTVGYLNLNPALILPLGEATETPKSNKYTWTASIGTSSTNSFTVNYNKIHATCATTDVALVACSATKSTSAEMPSSYFITTGGDVHINESDTGKDALNQTLFNLSEHFATDMVSVLQPSGNFLLRNQQCDASPSICSTKSLLLFGYSDNNTDPDWFTNNLNTSKNNLAISIPTPIEEPTNFGPALQSYDLVEINNNLTINSGSVCNQRTVFFVNGNLTIHPDFTIGGELDPAIKKNNACLFFVNGTTYIKAGSDSDQDLVEAFIITDGLELEDDVANHDQLLIKGGIITNGENVFARNLNYLSGGTIITSELPSEIIEYEGARYIQLFKEIIKMSDEFGIREPSYVN